MGNLWWLWFEGCKTKPFGMDDQCILGFQALKWMKFRHLDLSQGKNQRFLTKSLNSFCLQVTPQRKPCRRHQNQKPHQKRDPMLQHGARDGPRAEHGEKDSPAVGTAVKSSDMKWCEKWWSYSILTLTSKTFFVFGALLTLFLHLMLCCWFSGLSVPEVRFFLQNPYTFEVCIYVST